MKAEFTLEDLGRADDFSVELEFFKNEIGVIEIESVTLFLTTFSKKTKLVLTKLGEEALRNFIIDYAMDDIETYLEEEGE